MFMIVGQRRKFKITCWKQFFEGRNRPLECPSARNHKCGLLHINWHIYVLVWLELGCAHIPPSGVAALFSGAHGGWGRRCLRAGPWCRVPCKRPKAPVYRVLYVLVWLALGGMRPHTTTRRIIAAPFSVIMVGGGADFLYVGHISEGKNRPLGCPGNQNHRFGL